MLAECSFLIMTLCVSIIPNTTAVRVPAYVPIWNLIQTKNITLPEIQVLNGDVAIYSGEDRWISILNVYGPRLGAGQILVNKADRRLSVGYERLVRTFPISIGDENHQTPTGAFKIVRKQTLPTWYPSRSARRLNRSIPRSIPPGPLNPLGVGAAYLNRTAYLIHGTNDDWSIGNTNTLGCVRLRNADIVHVLDATVVGSRVEIIESGLVVWSEGEHTLARFALFHGSLDHVTVHIGGESIPASKLAEIASRNGHNVRSVIFSIRSINPEQVQSSSVIR